MIGKCSSWVNSMLFLLMKNKKGGWSVKSSKCLMVMYHVTLPSGWLDFSLYIQMFGIMQTQPQWFNQSTVFTENPPPTLVLDNSARAKGNVPSCLGYYSILLISSLNFTVHSKQTRILKHQFQDLSYLLKSLLPCLRFSLNSSCFIRV